MLFTFFFLIRDNKAPCLWEHPDPLILLVFETILGGFGWASIMRAVRSISCLDITSKLGGGATPHF